MIRKKGKKRRFQQRWEWWETGSREREVDSCSGAKKKQNLFRTLFHRLVVLLLIPHDVPYIIIIVIVSFSLNNILASSGRLFRFSHHVRELDTYHHPALLLL